LYILQVRNTFTDELLMQQKYETPYTIESLIDSAKDWPEWFIYDDQKRALKGSYAHHSIINDGNDTIYKLYFCAKLAKLPEAELMM
jgi:hypothetical protein